MTILQRILSYLISTIERGEQIKNLYVSELICVCKWTQTLAANLSPHNDAKTAPWNAGNIQQFCDIVLPDTEVKRKVIV
jgi:hypothetical protein